MRQGGDGGAWRVDGRRRLAIFGPSRQPIVTCPCHGLPREGFLEPHFAVGLGPWALPAHAERLPVLPQIDLPHPYYFREMYLPQLTSGPSSLAWSAGFPGPDLFHGRFAVEAEPRLGRRATTHRCLVRLSAGLVAGWPMGYLQFISQRCDGIVDTGLVRWLGETAVGERRGQPRAAILAGRQAHRVRIHAVQQAFSYFHGRYQRRQARSRRAPDRRAQERTAALLLQRLRS